MSDTHILEPKTKGLGRGLNALFEDSETDEIFGDVETEIVKQVEDAPAQLTRKNTMGIEELIPGRFQPRKVFNNDTLEELAQSIREHGVLQPLLVRAIEGEETHEIIAGERRWRAAQIAQMHEVPVIILNLEDLEAFKIALIENLQREDLDPIDEALGYKRLLEDYQQTQEALAKAVGKSRPHITNMLRLLNLPSIVQAHLSAGDISMGHARALVTAKDPEELVKQVMTQGLSVRQTEKLAATAAGREQKTRSSSSAGAAPSHSQAAGKDADTIALENDMSNALGMRVDIDSADGKSGSLKIEFKTLDQLDELLHRLAHYPGSHLNG